ncbi:MAG TPA: divergent polysaccharide deacetylase family protein [Thermodesulfobacteriota bacterium]|nr:divergent polysaccharide deacetylase family protein [Thermodesulfobacteriota bacterium]
MSLQKKRREPPFQVKGVIIFFLVVIALCVYTFYFLVPSPAKKKPEYISTLKPKRPSAPKIKDYTATCRQINQQIFLCAKDLGAHEKDFRILKEQSLQRKGKRWIHTEAKIYFPRNVDLSEAAQTLVEELKDFPGLSSKREKEENQFSLSLWLDEVLSHSFTFLHRPPQLAIIIDDIGEDLKQTKEFLDLGIPLTLSILPDQSYSKGSEELAHARGYEVMLHLPMEPKNRPQHNPGAGAIYTNMDEGKIAEIIKNHIKKFTYIKGVNNHMGSRATEDEKTMRAVLKALKPTGLYFVDSQTSSQSIAYSVAREMGIPSGENVIFIDNEPEVNYSKNFIDKAIMLVKKKGQGIIIGHPRETTLEALREMTPKLKAEGIALVSVSTLVQ